MSRIGCLLYIARTKIDALIPADRHAAIYAPYAPPLSESLHLTPHNFENCVVIHVILKQRLYTLDHLFLSSLMFNRNRAAVDVETRYATVR